MSMRRSFQMDGDNGNGGAANPPDLAGYSDVGELVKGYRASRDEVKRIQTEQAEFESQVRTFMAANQPQRPEPTDPYDRLTQLGVPADAVRDIVSREVRSAFEPIGQALNARTQMVARHPDYVKFEPEVSQFLTTDRDTASAYQKMSTADPLGAMEYAYFKYGESKRSEQSDGDSGRPKMRAAEPTHAGQPAARSGEGRSQETGDQQATTDAWEHFKKTGQKEPYIKARLRRAYGDDFLNQ